MTDTRDVMKTLTRAAKLLAAGLALALIARWLIYAAPALSREKTEREKLAPLINEARTLRINYESVLAYPYQTLGKPAIWCIQNRGPNEIFYEGDATKKLLVEEADKMPLFIGSKHASCTDMLVIVSSMTERKFSGQGIAFVGVKFIRQL